ncbi:MAG: IS3 family transposase [Clostridia bacterium]|nr:IS3 family transposase [Clostridia bacterium]MDD4375962.1 IS3 family transposase [Clostridia bacterium]
MLKNKYSINLLCNIVKCSRSGYYDWINSGRPKYKSFNEKTFNMIKEQYDKDTRQGIVRLRMNIKKIYGIALTNKTIYRYMKLLNIQSIIRKKKKKYSKVQHHNIPNLLKRDFNATKPNQKWSIDITYIHTIKGVEYLCAIKDLFDKSIVSYYQSNRNDNILVLTTVKMAIEQNNVSNLTIHSDQGHQFTSIEYKKLLKDNGINHSVSYKGSCADNVPIESFFSTLKSECIYLNKQFDREQSKQLVKDFIKYYNNDRLQVQLKELTPFEYRELVLR